MTVSNLSSTRALRDITEIHGQSYFASAVGEVNVVNKMKECNAVIGGEGNGGVIYPESHYGRDSIVGIGLFLSLLIEKNMKVSELLSTYPKYYMVKEKINLSKGIDVNNILKSLASKYSNENINEIDGLKIDFKDSWVHLRKSNTEPIIRIYSEAMTEDVANKLVNQIKNDIKELS
jgi:phosphomannomutase